MGSLFLIAMGQEIGYNSRKTAIVDFYVVFLAARAATEKHDKLYHSRSAHMV